MRYLGLLFISSLFTLNVFAVDFCNDLEWTENLTVDGIVELINQNFNFYQLCDNGYSLADIIMQSSNVDVEELYHLMNTPPTVYNSFNLSPVPSTELESPESCRFFMRDESGHNFSQSGFPVTLWFHSSVPDEYIESFQIAAQIWEDRFNTNFFDFQELEDAPFSLLSYLISFLPVNSGPIVSQEDSKSVIYWDENWDDNDATDMAKIYLYRAVSQITESDIIFNGKLYQYYTNTDIADGFETNGLHHLESLIIHEFGHVLGLKNNYNEGSVMGPLKVRDEIEDFDYRNIMCEYGHIIDL